MPDPRGDKIKDKVNKIKKTQEFRPLIARIRGTLPHEIFGDFVKKSQYM